MRRYLLELSERIGGMTADELGVRMGARELMERRALDEVVDDERERARQSAPRGR